MLRAIVIDDEEAGIDIITALAQRNASMIKIVASTPDALEGIRLIEDYRPELVFLDISMPQMSGFELLTRLSFRDFKLVFTTAHREYALEAIKNKAFDYLLKPIESGEFTKCITEIYNQTHPGSAEQRSDAGAVIELQVKDGIIYIRQKDIVRLEASRNYTTFYLDNGQRHIASKSMREFEARLDARIFYRCHKSHIINLSKVDKFVSRDGFFALMKDGSTPDVSRNNKDELLELLKNA